MLFTNNIIRITFEYESYNFPVHKYSYIYNTYTTYNIPEFGVSFAEIYLIIASIRFTESRLKD